MLAAWTTADIRLLRDLAEQGVELSSIAGTLGRTLSAIKNKAAMHGISLQAKRRRCVQAGW